MSVRKQKQNLEPRVGLGILIQNDEGQVLLGKRRGSHGAGTWCFPGGALDFGETVLEGARREVKEETGLDIKEFELISVADELGYIESDGKHHLNLGFKGKYEGGEPRVMEPEKCEGWEWFDLDNLPKPLLEGTAHVIKNFKAKKIYQP